MAVKIRLARHGKKNFAFFHIVVADNRAPRDGRYIAKLGTYNPNSNPAVIELDTDGALKWLYNGAQPTDTCRRILSYKGVLLKKHLQEGPVHRPFSSFCCIFHTAISLCREMPSRPELRRGQRIFRA